MKSLEVVVRESLGIALDTSSISTTLVDADTPLLGSIDEFRHPWGEGGSVRSFVVDAAPGES
ncbi:hypothetical protein ACSW29_23610 [Rhodococcus sp. GB-02]